MLEKQKRIVVSPELFEHMEALTVAFLDEDCKERGNPVPFAATVEQKADRLDYREELKRLIKSELSRQSQMQGMESFEEANDFDVEGDFDMDEGTTVYQQMGEEVFIPDLEPPEDPTTAGIDPNTDDDVQETPVQP